MEEQEKQNKGQSEQQSADKKGAPDGMPQNLYMLISVAATVIGGVFYGLMFTPLGVLSLCIATIFSLAALSLLNFQKKRGPVKFFKAALIAAYILFGLCILTFVGGTIYAAVYSG